MGCTRSPVGFAPDVAGARGGYRGQEVREGGICGARREGGVRASRGGGWTDQGRRRRREVGRVGDEVGGGCGVVAVVVRLALFVMFLTVGHVLSRR